MWHRNLDITEYYKVLQTLWQELDMHYEADWGYLEGNTKFRRHLEKERRYEFLVAFNKVLDEVRGRILGRRLLPSIDEAFTEVRREASSRWVMLGGKKDSPSTSSAGEACRNHSLGYKNSKIWWRTKEQPTRWTTLVQTLQQGWTQLESAGISMEATRLEAKKGSNKGKGFQAKSEEKTSATSVLVMWFWTKPNLNNFVAFWTS